MSQSYWPRHLFIYKKSLKSGEQGGWMGKPEVTLWEPASVLARALDSPVHHGLGGPLRDGSLRWVQGVSGC